MNCRVRSVVPLEDVPCLHQCPEFADSICFFEKLCEEEMADEAVHTSGHAAADVEAPMMEDLFGEDAPAYAGVVDPGVALAPQAPAAAAAAGVSEAMTLQDVFGDVSDDDADVVIGQPSSAASNGTSAESSSAQARPPGWRMSFGGSGATSAGASQATSELHLPALPAVAVDRVQSVRLPKIVTVASDAYDPDAYDEQAETAALTAADKLAARDSVIRWRARPGAAATASGAGAGADAGSSSSSAAGAADGAADPGSGAGAASGGVESNARVVEWSDGSLTLHIGRQVFALSTQRGGEALQAFARVTAVQGSSSTTSGSGGKRGADAAAAAAAGSAASAPSGPRETVLVGRQLVSSRLLVRSIGGAGGGGTSVSSALLVGAGVGAAAGSAAGGAAGAGAGAGSRPARVALQQVNLLADPEREKAARIRAEEEAARALENQKRAGEAAARKAGRRFGGAGGMDEDYDYAAAGAGAGRAAGGDEAELGLGEGEEEETSLKALKARASGRGRGRGRGRGGAGAGRGGRAAASGSSDEGSASEDSDDDAAPKRRAKKPVPKKARKAAASSDDEDSASESGSDSSDSDDSDSSSGSGSSSDGSGSSESDSSSGSDE